MPKKVTLGKTNQTLELEDTLFAAGGEGELYRVIAPLAYQNFVAKLYFKNKRTELQKSKIQYLIQNPPDIVHQEEHPSIIWIEDSVAENGEFAGFIMPFTQGAKLEILCTQKIPKNYIKDWQRFDPSSPESQGLRLNICYHIAAAVNQIHKTQKYVLVDLKPDNILIRPNGLISIVDMDSVQVIENGVMKYAARVATAEFSPPEYFYEEAKPGQHTILETWDRFSLAVIFYKILFGIHPYAGTGKPPYDHFVNLQDKIKHGQFVHGLTKKKNFDIIPPPHQAFNDLPIHIQNLFIRCFEYGHKNVYDRPSADEWCWGMTPQPTFANLRRLPSSLLAIQNIDYTSPMSLSPLNASLQFSSQQHLPTKSVRLAQFNTNFTMVRIAAGGTIAFILFWIFGLGMPLTWFTVFQILSAVLTSGLVAIVGYRHLEVVKEKNKVQEVRKKLGQEKRHLRKKVNQFIREAQSIPQTELELQNKFYEEQDKVLQRERAQMDEMVSSYHRKTTEMDKQILEWHQEELKQMKALETELTKNVDLTVVEQIRFLPIGDKIKWIENHLLEVKEVNVQDQLLAIKEKLILANEQLESEKGKISAHFDAMHDKIKKVCENAYHELMAAITEIHRQVEQENDDLLKKILPNQENAIKESNESLKEVKKHIYELEDLYRNFNTVSDKLLDYQQINFLEYCRQGLLFKKTKT